MENFRERSESGGLNVQNLLSNIRASQKPNVQHLRWLGAWSASYFFWSFHPAMNFRLASHWSWHKLTNAFFKRMRTNLKFKAMKQQANLNQFKPTQANVAKNGGGGWSFSGISCKDKSLATCPLVHLSTCPPHPSQTVFAIQDDTSNNKLQIFPTCPCLFGFQRWETNQTLSHNITHRSQEYMVYSYWHVLQPRAL